MTKLLWYIFSFLISFFLLVITLKIFYSLDVGLVLLLLPIIAISCALIGCFVFSRKYKDIFTNFTVFISILSGSVLFTFIGPVVVERSLSCFIYFEAVEKGQIDKSSIQGPYLKKFVQKRFDDGVKGGFLKETDSGKYEPTFKGRVFYYVFSFLGKMTTKPDNYQEFISRTNTN